MAKRRAMQFPGAMPEEIAFAKRRQRARATALRVDGAFAVAVSISLLLFVLPLIAGWTAGSYGGAAGIACAVLAGGVVSVLVTFLAARAWTRFAPGDRLFADATIGGWLRRARADREIARARKLFADPDVAVIELHQDRMLKIAGALEARDARTHRHSSRVAVRAEAIGKQLGLTGDELTRLRAAARLHDVGALKSPAWLDATEEERLATALAGAELIEFTGDRRLVSAVRHQHERYDGSGMPDGLAGDAIPFAARVIAVADAYDRLAREHGQSAAVAELLAGAGSIYDPAVVDALAVQAHAGPVAALRGAAAGVFPRAAQGAADLLRGSATVAAAASIATTAVVAGGVGSLPATHHSAGHEAPAAVAATTPAAAAVEQSRGGHHRTARGDARTKDAGGKDKSSEDLTGGGNHTQSDVSAGSPQSKDSSSGGSDSAGSGGGTQSNSNPVEDLTQDVSDTVDNTTQTVNDTVGDVTDTVNDTVDSTTDTVNNVVGGLTGKK